MMAEHTKFKDIKHKADALPTAEREALREQAHADMHAQGDAFDQTLAQLRRARGLTQTQLAKSLGVSQTRVSKVERHADLYLSTLVSYLAAMDAELELCAVLEDGRRVPLQMGDLTGESVVEEREREPA